MRLLPILIVAGAAALSGCGSVASNTGNNANLRGQNTNTGYTTNAETNAKPTVPANAVNITPGNITNGNTNTNSNANSNANSNRK